MSVPFFCTAVDAERCRRRACGRAVGPVGGRPAFAERPVAAAPKVAGPRALVALTRVRLARVALAPVRRPVVRRPVVFLAPLAAVRAVERRVLLMAMSSSCDVVLLAERAVLAAPWKLMRQGSCRVAAAGQSAEALGNSSDGRVAKPELRARAASSTGPYDR